MLVKQRGTVRTAAIVNCVVSGVLLVSCGGSSSPDAVRVSAVAEATQAAGTTRFDLRLADASAPLMAGTYDFSSRHGSAVYAGSEYQLEIRWISGHLHFEMPEDLRVPASGEVEDPCAGRTWVEFDLDDDISTESASLAPPDPTQLVQRLGEHDYRLIEDGNENIDGVPVRRFTVHGELQELVPRGLDRTVVADRVIIWVDSQGRLRRIEWIDNGGSSTRMSYYDFGTSYEPPVIAQDEVCSFDAWAGYALRNF
jgi:hypothetical protein